jgi:DeoR family transcriptional regulator, aga operon transcriptional repressor
MKREDRLSQILEIIARNGAADVESVASHLRVSAATIRRDFDVLAERQLVSRTHGGAVATSSSINLPLKYKAAKNDQVKKLIALEAAKYVERYQVIGLNGGTTTTEVARALAIDTKFSPIDEQQPALTVVTNIAAELTVRHQIKIMVTGGVARPQSFELTGPYAEQVLNEVNIDIAILGVEAIDTQKGASARHEDEARVNRQIASRAEKLMVVTESSKFSKRAFANIAPIGEIDILITDSGIQSETIEELRDSKVEVVIVS